MELIGYLLAILMGAILGTIGAGGSILTLPILVYFIGINPTLATSYTLIIVGFTALAGSIKYIKNKQINIIVSLIFVIPSLLSVYLTRRYFLPMFPDSINIGQLIFTKDFLIMIIFSLLMFIAAYLMIFTKANSPNIYNNKLYNNFKIILEGSLVGFFTGIIGAGGGFLIIPALVIFSGINMKTAVGTSLLIIFIKSFVGFIGDLQIGININYNLIVIIALCASFGILIGTKFSKNISANYLKISFGYFLIIISLVIIIMEVAKLI